MKDVQLVVVQAASDCVGGGSSETNSALAVTAKVVHDMFGAPVFPQAEVGKILQLYGVPVVGTTEVYSEISIFNPKYPGTQGIATQHKELCDRHGWTTVALVAFYPHAWRARWTYERMGLKVVIPWGLPKMIFQRNLAQKRWRRAITAYPYELMIRLGSLYKGYI